jgi:tetratricopeptide (TPR) repeat protein
MERLNNDLPPESAPAEALRAQQRQWLQPLLERLDQAEAASDWELVERLCKQILQRDGENWSVWQRLALAYEARKDWTQAETLWRHLTQRFSNRPEPYLALAELQRRLGTPDAARAVLEEAERRVGGSEALRRSLAAIDDPWAVGEAVPTLSAEAPAAAVAQALQLAQGHLDQARFAEAEAVLDQILVARPQAVKVHLTLAKLRQRRSDHQGVIDQLLPLYQPCPEQGPLAETLDLPMLLLQALQEQQRFDDASALLEPLLRRFPEAAPPQLLAATLHLERGDAARAHGLVQRCLRLHPQNAQAHRLQGELCLRLGDADAAVQALQQALAIEPAHAHTAQQLESARHLQLWQRGEAALRQAAWQQAEQAYRKVLERDPGHRQALARLDLLASLRSTELLDGGASMAAVEASSPESPDVRLQAFRYGLDRIETQLKMLGVEV